MKTALLEARAITVDPVFRDLELSLHSREIFQITGPSGSGKSSLLKTLVRATPAHQATLRYRGNPVMAPDIVRYRSRVHYVPQEARFTGETVEEVLTEPFSYHIHKDRKFSHDQARHWLKQFHLEDISLTSSAAKLSGGEIQRICLIRSLLLAPEILLLDEPTSALDPTTTTHLYSALFEHFAKRKEEWAIIIVSHSENERIAQSIPPQTTYRIGVVDKGTLT